MDGISTTFALSAPEGCTNVLRVPPDDPGSERAQTDVRRQVVLDIRDNMEAEFSTSERSGSESHCT